MSATHSSSEVRDSGMLETGDGNRVYWEERGNPDGKPAVIVHGGPGGGSPSGTPKLFDPERYRIILFDQRGCGRSTPHASDLATDMSLNTTEHLLRDMEQLRAQLGVEQWLLFGGSWGSALSVAYAERHPERVSEMILPAFWLMGRAEVDWLYRGGVARLFPEEWERFSNGISEDVVAAYVKLLNDPDVQVRSRAALNWSAWEDAVLSLEPHGKPAPFSNRASADLLAFARICAHYAANDGWFEDGALLRGAANLAGVPGVIVHGRLDLSCPFDAAWRFAQVWPGVELVAFADAGHKGSPAMHEYVRNAVARFAES
ncbi:prolyl aminopeptidase [Kribbella sp. NBC_00709]|uniref:prolyl aminopeptidase n=1 Tax=Kribbella sp. NBC_00709 TaxID=2975972 RepID=UPI002E2A6213|nr:prolyl aminopeptidase [Kribbella sp. NBC_00709]